MVSRKTYFGIGWKDPSNPEPGAPGKPEPDDRSAPTVVDDEKVAEGLRQLRSWYSGDTQAGAPSAPDATRPAPQADPLAASQARPTAVGHATGPPPAAQQRSVAPDPMRATMYGHDVHQFDLDMRAAAAAEPAPPAAASAALVVADPARQREVFGQQAEAIPDVVGRPSSDSFPLASYRQGEAERLHRPGHRSASYAAPRPRWRMPTASHVVFGIGIAALTAAIVIWSQAGDRYDSTPAAPRTAPSAQVAPPQGWTTIPVPTAVAPKPAPALLSTAPARPPAPRANAGQAVPVRSSAGSSPAPGPIPAASVATAKTERLPVAIAKPPRRHKEPPAEVGNADIAAPIDSAMPEAKEPQEAREQKELKDLRELREAREPKEQPKGSKDLNEAREPKQPKASKETKARSSDADATLPPSLD